MMHFLQLPTKFFFTALLVVQASTALVAQSLPKLVPILAKSRKWGLADTTGKIIVPCSYTKAQVEHLGLAFVIDNEGNKQYFNPKGQKVAQLDRPEYLSHSAHFVFYKTRGADSYTRVFNHNSKEHYVSSTDSVVPLSPLSTVFALRTKMLKSYFKRNKEQSEYYWELRDSNDKVVGKFNSTNNVKPHKRAAAFAYFADDTWHLIDEKGETRKLRNAGSVEPYGDKYWLINNSVLYHLDGTPTGVILSSSESVLMDSSVLRRIHLRDPFLVAARGYEYAIYEINTARKWIIPLDFLLVNDSAQYAHRVTSDDGYPNVAAVDLKTGKQMFSLRADSAAFLGEDRWALYNSYYERWSIVDEVGQTMIGFTINRWLPFLGGYAPIEIDMNVWVFTNPLGEYRFESEDIFQFVFPQAEGYYCVMHAGAMGIIKPTSRLTFFQADFDPKARPFQFVYEAKHNYAWHMIRGLCKIQFNTYTYFADKYGRIYKAD